MVIVVEMTAVVKRVAQALKEGKHTASVSYSELSGTDFLCWWM